MTRSRIAAAMLALGLLAGLVVPALAQTVVAPPGSTVVVQPPATTTAAVVPVTPWCGGAYGAPGGTNFGSCPGYLPR